jgi:hypothetical protein
MILFVSVRLYEQILHLHAGTDPQVTFTDIHNNPSYSRQHQYIQATI